MDTFIVDAATGELRPIAESHGIGSVTDISHDGRRAVVSRMVSRGDNNGALRFDAIRDIAACLDYVVRWFARHLSASAETQASEKEYS